MKYIKNIHKDIYYINDLKSVNDYKNENYIAEATIIDMISSYDNKYTKVFASLAQFKNNESMLHSIINIKLLFYYYSYSFCIDKTLVPTKEDNFLNFKNNVFNMIKDISINKVKENTKKHTSDLSVYALRSIFDKYYSNSLLEKDINQIINDIFEEYNTIKILE